jgi:hypothetical protein
MRDDLIDLLASLRMAMGEEAPAREPRMAPATQPRPATSS